MITVGEVLSISNGSLIFGSVETNITRFIHNSKEVSSGCCFVAIKGEHTDGNNYIRCAIENGASVILTEKEPCDLLKTMENESCFSEKAGAYILTDNVYNTLKKTARYFRDKNIKNVIAVTGSVGKTTVKELIHSVLSEGIEISKTEGNQNSNLGLSLTLLSGNMKKNAVLELGISQKGEMELLSECAAPSVAVITNIGVSHGEHLGGRESIAGEKLKIIKGMKEGGTLIINGDEPLLQNAETEKKCKNNNIKIISVSMKNKDSDYCVCNVKASSGGTFFDILKRGNETIKRLFVPIIGHHGAFDGALCVAVAEQFGLAAEKIRKGLSKYIPCGYRQLLKEINGRNVILDCYNASPDSFFASLDALDTLSDNTDSTNKAVVAGSMLELGECSEIEHIKVGQRIALSKPKILITVGSEGRLIAKGARISGMNEENIYSYACGKVKTSEISGRSYEKGGKKPYETIVCPFTKEHQNGRCKEQVNDTCCVEIAQLIKKKIPFGSFVLIKGSRRLRLERIAGYL